MRTLAAIALAAALTLPEVEAQIHRGGVAGGANVQQTTNIINDCERRTNQFKKTLDRALARDNVRAGQGREAQLNNNASRLENQLDRVGDSWNKDHSLDKTREHVRAAIALGNDINMAMSSWNMGGDAESEWSAVRGELNRLANTFNVPRIR
jgi:hypothetical protein